MKGGYLALCKNIMIFLLDKYDLPDIKLKYFWNNTSDN